MVALRHERGEVDGRGRQLGIAGQVGAHLAERAGAAHLEALDHGGLGYVVDREQQPAAARVACRDGHREGAADRPEVAFQTDLAHHHEAVEGLVRQLAAGGEHAQRDGQVQPGAGFLNVSRGQIDGDATKREGISRIRQGGPDPFTALTYRAVREAYGSERGQAGADVDLDIDRIGIDAQNGSRPHAGKHDRAW